MAPEKSIHGFTLVELAIVLTVLGLIVGLGSELLPLLVKQNKLMESRACVQEARTALIGYALASGRLPFAGADTSGSESPGRLSGYLPWSVLGIHGVDAYMQTLAYAVDTHLTTTTTIEEFTENLNQLISGIQPPDLFCDNGATATACVIISAGENRLADTPNDDNHNGRVDIHDDNRFAAVGQPIDRTYDDILQAVSAAYLRGRLD